MKKWTLGLVFVLAFGLSSLAQTSSTSGSSMGQSGSSDQMGDTNKSKSKSDSTMASEGKGTSVTGCLNGSAGNYTLTNSHYKNGVAVTAASGVDLAPHVGHTVKLTGTWEKGSESVAAGGTSASKTFNATSMKHISDTCTASGTSKSGTKGSKSGETSSEPPK